MQMQTLFLPWQPARDQSLSDISILQVGAHALFRHVNDRLRCFAFIHPASDDLFFVRVNSLYLYSETNRNVWHSIVSPFLDDAIQILKHLGGLLGLPADDTERAHIHPSVKVAPKSQVAPDCIVGESVTVGERCSVKRSVIGKHCVIADGVCI